MTKRLIPRSSSELPPSTIYLDDLLEMEEIIRSCVPEGRKILNFQYAVDGEFAMDSIQELESHGGSVRTLTIGVASLKADDPSGCSASETNVLMLGKHSSSLLCPHWSKLTLVDLQSRITSVFDQRKDRLRVAFESLPSALSFILFFAFIWMISGAIAWVLVASGRLGPKDVPSFVYAVAALLGILLIGLLALRSRFTINLRYIQASRMAKSDARRKFLGRILWLLIGGAIALLFELVKGLIRR